MVLYAVDAKLRGQTALDPAKAFTAVSIISLVTIPANALLATFPQFGSILGTIRRIQKYLLEPYREDKRQMIVPSPERTTQIGGSHDQNQRPDTSAEHSSTAVSLDDVTLRPATTAKICLEDVTIRMTKGSLNAICGAVGTGKTTLARAILGDVPPEKGTIAVSTKRIGYCGQKPWLINASIRSIICGPSHESTIDEEWYNTVIQACGLAEDLQQFSNRDSFTVGSRGATLSGGQRQRVVRQHSKY